MAFLQRTKPTMTSPLIQIRPETHDVLIDLVYATPNNLARRAIYRRPLCLLHRDAEMPLRRAVANAARHGLRLKIFDAFRPREAQQLLWQSLPDSEYVADPHLGSNHTRGTAIDLTLIDARGHELDMGTGFDDMSPLSHHFCTLVSAPAQSNRMLLLRIMEDAGFEPIAHEWWHYALPRNAAHTLIDSTLLADLDPMRSAA